MVVVSPAALITVRVAGRSLNNMAPFAEEPTWRIFVLGPAVCQITLRSAPCGTAEVIARTEAGLVGFSPARNWA